MNGTANPRRRAKVPLRGTQNGLIVFQPHEVGGFRRLRPLAVPFMAWFLNDGMVLKCRFVLACLRYKPPNNQD